MRKMLSSTWFVSIVVLLTVDTRTRALQPDDLVPRICYQCPSVQACDNASRPFNRCPADRPYCATLLIGPNYKESLTCAPASEKNCNFSIDTTTETFNMICVCTTNLCNAPFEELLKDELTNFSSSIIPRTKRGDVTETFWKSTSFVNVTKASLYKMITVATTDVTVAPAQLVSEIIMSNNNIAPDSTIETHVLRHSEKMVGPRVAALKERTETTMPSDDDEDGSEGSGSYEETRAPGQASAPAAPSSYLPADKSKAPPLLTGIITNTLIIFLIIM